RLRHAETELQALTDELDRTDPGWRWDDIQAARPTIPEDENAGNVLLAVPRLLPKEWPPSDSTLFVQIREFKPNERLENELVAEARAELAPLGEALARARSVRDLPKGRYQFTLARNPYNTPLRYAQDLFFSSALLEIDVILRAHD